MDIHKVSDLPERLTVVELGRRRRWSEEEKLRIVLESLEAPRLVSAVGTTAWDHPLAAFGIGAER